MICLVCSERDTLRDQLQAAGEEPTEQPQTSHAETTGLQKKYDHL